PSPLPTCYLSMIFPLTLFRQRDAKVGVLFHSTKIFIVPAPPHLTHTATMAGYNDHIYFWTLDVRH
ncbi:hypothetical protein, partial [Taibaiella helva]|uniref:hypothetical protein n=1 Tax=Taibaiella helva TaxID=2301235 RepID=UPI001E56ED08